MADPYLEGNTVVQIDTPDPYLDGNELVNVQPPLLNDDVAAGIRGRANAAEAETFIDALEAGWQISVSGLTKRGRNPDVVLPEDANMALQIVSGLGTVAGDIPAMVAGAIAAQPVAIPAATTAGGLGALSGPAAPIVSPILAAGTELGITGAAAFGAPEWIRAGLMEFYDRGGTDSQGYVANLMSSFFSERALKAGGKGLLIGAATGPAGAAGRVLARPAGQVVSKIAGTTSEIGAAVTTASALEGELPKAQDFLSAAALVTVLHGAGRVAKPTAARATEATKQAAAWLRGNYMKTGEPPLDAAIRLQTDPVARQEMYLDVLTKDRADGYTFDAFHGTTANIIEFDTARSGSNSGAASKSGAIFFAKDPELANQYALEPGSSGANVVPVRLKLSNPLVVDGEGKMFGGGSNMTYFLNAAKAQGHDGVVFKNLRDSIAPGENKPATVYAVFDKSQIRGKFGGLDETYGQAIDRLRAMSNPARIASDVAEEISQIELAAAREAAKSKRAPNPERDAQIQSEAEAIARGETPITPEDRVKALSNPSRIAADAANDVAGVEAAAVSEFQRTQSQRFSPNPEKDAQINAEVAAMVRAAGGGKDFNRPPSGGAGDGGKKPPKDTILEHIKEPKKRQYTFDDYLYDFYTDLQWANVAVRDALDATIGKKARKKVAPENNPAEQLRLAFGSYARAEFTISSELKPIVDPIIKAKQWDDFVSYSVARRAVELDSRGIETGIAPDIAQAEVARSGAKFAKAFDEVVAYQNRLLDEAVDAGIVSAKQRDLYVELNKNYVPFTRVMDENAAAGKVGTRGFNVRNPAKKIEGSSLAIANPYETIVKNTYVWKQVIDNNKALHRLIDFSNTLPESQKFLKKTSKPISVTELSKSDRELASFLADHGIDPAQADGILIYRAAQRSLTNEQILVYENGEPVIYQGDANLIKSLRALDKTTHNVLVKLLQIPAAAFRAGTTLTPEFMARNFVRDQLGAVMQNTFKTVPGLDFAHGIGGLLKKEDGVKDWINNGGANSALLALDKDIFKKDYFALQSQGALPINRAWNLVATPFRMMQLASMMVENASRYGQYKRSIKAGESGIVAAMRSRDVTLDFYRMGARIRALNAMGSFLGPQINSLGRAVEAFDRDPMGTTLKGVATITLPTVMLWWANHDEEWYKKQSQLQKDAFWLFKVDVPVFGDTIMRLPKPPVFGMLFGTLIERLLEAYVADNPHAWEEIGQTLNNELNPISSAVPVAGLPFYEIGANWNYFSDTPLVSQAMEESTLPEYRYTKYTSETAKQIAKSIPEFIPDRYRTPVALDHLIKTWTGGVGKYVVELADQGLYAAGVVDRPVNPTRTLSDIPFIRAFTVSDPSANTSYIDRFYSRTDRIKQVLDTFETLAKSGQVEEADALLAQYGSSLINLSDIRSTLGDMRGTIRSIYENPEITPDEKRQLIDELYTQMNAIAKYGDEILDANEYE